MIKSDTICALATAPGGALGVIRISGEKALPIASSVCCDGIATSAPNTVRYVHIKDESGSLIDEAMVSVFHAPHSYTGEDSVEISCHGSQYILNKVLELLVQHGCRMAEPGEYTMRAYLNGKMDLSQAEAVADLIASTNQATHKIAMAQLRGHFSSELAQLRSQLLRLTSLLELELDFSDHEDLEFADRSELFSLAQNIDSHISHLSHTFETGQALKQGIPVAIVGKTNVGKSTLLNHLLGEERAIVSDIHGTTRDTIEDTMEIQGLTFRFIDTAGLRETTDTVEQIGIDRTYAAIQKALVVIWLLDKRPSRMEMERMHDLSVGKQSIYIHNKIDTIDMNDFVPYIVPITLISAKQGIGIDNVKKRIYECAQRLGLTDSDIIVTNARHYDALQRAYTHLQQVIEGLNNGLSGDLLSEDLRLVLNTLAEITGGQITPQETLNTIFSHFCIGK